MIRTTILKTILHSSETMTMRSRSLAGVDAVDRTSGHVEPCPGTFRLRQGSRSGMRGRLNQLKLLPFNLRISSITQKPGAHHSSKVAFIQRLASFCLGALFTLTALCQAPPTSNGVYVQQPGHWRRLYVAPVGLTRFGDGSGSTKIFSVYRDPHATTAVKGPWPVFSWSGFNDNISPRDVLIVRLAQKKDHRELQYATSDPHRGITPGYLPQDRVEVQVRDDGNLRTVTPKADLAPGEYMLFTGAPGVVVAPGTRFTAGLSVLGFDFQVVK
jgi:hypothetical protein